MTYDSSLSLLNGYNQYGYGNYNSYNSFGMYGSYGYGNVTDVQGAKDNIANQYDVYTTQQSYGNMQNIENMTYAQRSNTIAELLREGRATDASKQFDTLCGELKASSLYSSYSDAQIKAVAQSIYQRSTGENLTETIKSTTGGSFEKGLVAGIPIVGWFTDNTSKEELLSKVTGVEQRPGDKVAKALGSAITGGAVGVGVALGAGAIGAKIGGTVGTVLGPCGTVAGAIIGGAIGIVAGLFKSEKK